MKVFRIDVCDDVEPEVWMGRWTLLKLDDRRDLSGVAGGVQTLTFALRSPEEWELADVETSCSWPILRSESERPLPDEGACCRRAGETDPVRLGGLCDDDDSSSESGPGRVGVFGMGSDDWVA